MEPHQPYVRPRLTARIAHPGVLAVIVVASAVLLWDTLALNVVPPLLVALVVAQVLLLALSYRWPVPALVACCVLTLVGDAVFTAYSAYSLYAIMAVLGLWAYRTCDAAAVGAVVTLSAYQCCWLALTGGSMAQSLLFAAMFILDALLGCALRHVFVRLRLQREHMRQMRAQVRRSAHGMHDAVAGRLTEVDLLLQRRELQMTASDRTLSPDDIVELDQHVRAQLDGIATDVAHIVDLLLEQTKGDGQDPYVNMQFPDW